MATASVGVLLRSPGGGTLCGARAAGSLRCEHLSELSVEQGLSPWHRPPEGPGVGVRTQPERPPQERRTGSIPTTGAEMPPEPAWPKLFVSILLELLGRFQKFVCIYSLRTFHSLLWPSWAAFLRDLSSPTIGGTSPPALKCGVLNTGQRLPPPRPKSLSALSSLFCPLVDSIV